MNVPKRKRATITGTSHHLLLLQKKDNSWPTTPKRPAAVRAALTTPMIVSSMPSLVSQICQRQLVAGRILEITGNSPGREFISPRTQVRLIHIHRFLCRIKQTSEKNKLGA